MSSQYKDEFTVKIDNYGRIIRYNSLAAKDELDEFTHVPKSNQKELQRFLDESLKARSLGQKTYTFYYGMKRNIDGGLIYDVGIHLNAKLIQKVFEYGLRNFRCRQITYYVLSMPNTNSKYFSFYLKIEVVF